MDQNEMTNLSLSEVSSLYKTLGGSFFAMDLKKAKRNFHEFLGHGKTIYSNFKVAYSFKTNYTPVLCNALIQEGALAEIVSETELQLADQLKVPSENVIVNGPFHSIHFLEKLYQRNILVNLDSFYQLDYLKRIVQKNPGKHYEVGIRINLAGENSRFGFECSDSTMQLLIKELQQLNISIVSLHCHEVSGNRSEKDYMDRTVKLLSIYDNYFQGSVKSINLGGGFYSFMPEMLIKQFGTHIPDFKQYAEAIAIPFNNYFKTKSDKPFLIIEPGNALVADVMDFYAMVIDLKQIGNKTFALMDASIYDIKPTKAKRNLPCSVYSINTNDKKNKTVDMVGYTCMEDDVMYKGYVGPINKGDYVVFSNVGGYTNVLKPPFINPARPIVVKTENSFDVVRREENFDSFFNSYNF